MSVTAAAGFRAAGVTAGLKASGKPDVALVVNDGPEYTAAGVFTTNRVVAAPVVWTRQAISDGAARAVILNSGGANACTGSQGFLDTHTTAEFVSETLGADEVGAGDVMVCSTGLIGELLDMPKLTAGVTAAAEQLSADGGPVAAQAIMTTDTVPKEATSAGAGYAVGGMAKGAGMLNPALATMLVVITTDASLDASTAQAALETAVETTFNRLDSDGCMSTNDTVLLLASGASGATPSGEEFAAVLTEVCASLARQLIADAEGASHDIAVTVRNAASEAAAVAVARAVTSSNLLKAAIFGNDPNWGSVLAAVGTVPEDVAPFEADQLDVYMNGIQVARAGGVGESRDLVDLTPREVTIEIDLHAGEATATIWTNDLTHDYVHENSDYST